MKGLFCNIGGWSKDQKQRFMRDLFSDKHLEFLGLQETIKIALLRMNYISSVEVKNLVGSGLLPGVGLEGF